MKNGIDITVIMPALNEEENIVLSINNTLKAFENLNLSGEIIVINDGSTDRTEDLVKTIQGNDNRIKIIKHRTPQGIGASFWDGVDNARGESVVVSPGDNENDPEEILRYYRLLDDVDLVVPFVFNSQVRTLFRNMVSFLYRLIINTTFLTSFNYTNGTILYRKSILKEVDYRCKDFFFQTDVLIRMVKKGYLFAEVPYRLGARKDGISKALSLFSLICIIKGYLKLVRDCYFKKREKTHTTFIAASLTAVRRK